MARILVVDDEEHVRRVLWRQLRRAGHEASTAGDGKRAVELIAEDPPDLLILDLIMPEKDGLETLGDVRRQHPGLPVLAISGGGRTDPNVYLRIAEGLGAAATLAKPFGFEELLAVVDRTLAQPVAQGR